MLDIELCLDDLMKTIRKYAIGYAQTPPGGSLEELDRDLRTYLKELIKKLHTGNTGMF